MKIFTLPPNENWICDRFVNEWNIKNNELYTSNPFEADIIWLLADWCWTKIHPELLRNKKVCASVHHIVPEKFKERELYEWKIRDQFVDFYHVPCKKTYDQISSLTDKPIYTFPFWTNSYMWYHLDKMESRNKLNLPPEKYIIGSFQRDTEGHDLISPKLEKGPDLFVDHVIKMKKENDNIYVLLGGWRRQYVISRLEKENIPYTYNEFPSDDILNLMYNSLDLYIVTARYEGGPQAIVECGLSKTPIISTDVGLASELMNPKSVKKIEELILAEPDVDYLYNKCIEISSGKKGMEPFIEMFKSENLK